MKSFYRACGGVVVALLVAGTALGQTQTEFERECARLAKLRGRDSLRLHQLFALDWQRTLRENPEFATEIGTPGHNHRWTDNSLEAIARRKRELKAPLQVIASIRRERLSVADRLNYDLFKRNYELALEGTRFPNEYFQITQLNGIQQDIARLLEVAPRNTIKDYEDQIARLRSVPTVVEQTMTLLRRGLAEGITPSRVTLRDVPQQARNQLERDPAQSAFLRAFQNFPATIPASEQERLRAEAADALQTRVLPAFEQFATFLEKEYVPGARESLGMSELPDGRDWYEFSARVSTTTKLTPDEIHELGLAEVKRIRGEMDKIISQVGFKGSFAEFCEFLRHDPQFYYTNANDLLAGYRDISKRADPQLAFLFGRLPRLPYGVKAIPAFAEKSQTTAYYQPGSPDAGRPGWFYANTYDIKTRLKWEMEALTLHEAVPGHHLQIALAQELEGIPEFRKHGSYTAFVEGWGLYAESLGTEMGFYQDPYSKFGQLTYEMWRAVRLVVDTGIHAKGWTRQQAIDFFMANASKSPHDITVEVDRYIAWPGQALAYKIGELKIKELRAYATRELGENFNVREFHDRVLGEAALPLDVLEARIREWVESRSATRG